LRKKKKEIGRWTEASFGEIHVPMNQKTAEGSPGGGGCGGVHARGDWHSWRKKIVFSRDTFMEDGAREGKAALGRSHLLQRDGCYGGGMVFLKGNDGGLTLRTQEEV